MPNILHRIAPLTLLLVASSATADDDLAAAFTKDAAPILEAYCTSCHGGEKTKAEVDLKTIRSLGDALKHPALLEDALAQIEDGEMPPDDERQPTAAEKSRLTAWIRAALNSGDDTDDPGRTTVRRLNKTEYRNTVRDLFGVDFDPGRSFPADGSGGAGFDNTADALFIPPVLMEKYLAAAGEVLDKVFANDKLSRPLLTPAPQRGKLTPKDAASGILHRFLSRAFRRPVAADEIARYRTLADNALDRGDPFADAVKLSLKATLVSPHFLFRVEKTPPGTTAPYAVPPFELASRLSYFLWSSMPDAPLFADAANGTLTQPPILAAHVDRMLADPRAESLSHNFAAQWLGFDELIDKVQPDGDRFPEFTRDVRAAMYREGTMFFHHMVTADRPLTDLVDADYTFLNAPLAEIYDIPGVTGKQMRKVSLSGQPNRGGVLTMGGVLAATSMPLRTSPVIRGKWVLEDLIGDPPPPPPQDAGVLPADDKPTAGLTFRQVLERHRRKPECAGCHSKIDPIGFGLENFDPIGRWRTTLHGKPVDSLGKLPDGTVFNGPGDLKKTILSRSDEFTRNVTQKMLAYALGRGLEFHDRRTVQQITATVAADNHSTRTLIHQIARSYPFTHRRP